MLGTINGAYINRTIVDGAGWESFLTANLSVIQADAAATASGVTSLGIASTLQDGADWMLGLTFTLVDAQAPNSFANHTVSAAVGASVGGQSNTLVDAQGTSLDSAVAVGASLIGVQAAHTLLAAGKLNDLAAALNAIQGQHTLSATATVQLVGDSTLARADDAHAIDGASALTSAVTMAQEDHALHSFIRSLLASHGYGEPIDRHAAGPRLTPHGPGVRATAHGHGPQLTPHAHGSNLTVH